ncbi:NADH-quinone oxidoreductase subunit J [Desulfobacterota bacterium AH_259_B03_O07]|nr:NADH-quinone oxidoreductase subunit J [Desulfobacterota bacterium AH_259_B03_O07]
MEDILFYIFAAASVAGALLVVTHNNPVVSVLSLVLTLFSTAVLFVFLLADFIAAIQILVYAGAIMVLFIFTVMYLNLRKEALAFDSKSVPIKFGILFVILIVVAYLSSLGFKRGLQITGEGTSTSTNFGTVEGVGEVLFTKYILPFELTSVLIVVAIIGVVAIAKRRFN